MKAKLLLLPLLLFSTINADKQEAFTNPNGNLECLVDIYSEKGCVEKRIDFFNCPPLSWLSASDCTLGLPNKGCQTTDHNNSGLSVRFVDREKEGTMEIETYDNGKYIYSLIFPLKEGSDYEKKFGNEYQDEYLGQECKRYPYCALVKIKKCYFPAIKATRDEL